jgi:ribonuclease BN (tRNA processing enzyme)
VDGDNVRIILLGTGTTLPQENRNASGLLVQINGEFLLFDIGNGILRQLARAIVDFKQVNNIFISHLHADHINDLPLLLKANLMVKKKEKVTIFGPSTIRKVIGAWFFEVYPYLQRVLDQIEIREIKAGCIEASGWKLEVFPVQHGIEAYGFKLLANGKTMVYSGDTGFSEELIHASKNADILIHECSYPSEIEVKGHTSPLEVGRIAQQANVKQLVLTHFYPPCSGREEEMLVDVKKSYSGKLLIGQDLQEFILD